MWALHLLSRIVPLTCYRRTSVPIPHIIMLQPATHLRFFTLVIANSEQNSKHPLFFPFQVSVAVIQGGSLGQASTGQVTLSLDPQPIAVSVSGGDRLANSAKDLTLLAVSKDPDNSADLYGTPYPFQYTWTCSQALPDGALNALYQADATNNFGQFLTIPGGTLADGVYHFFVSVSLFFEISGSKGRRARDRTCCGQDTIYGGLCIFAFAEGRSERAGQ